MAGSEIIADFSSEVTIDEDVNIVPFPEKLVNLKWLVYYRHEHNYYNE